jgi:pterin-4a-carbinolamine dehydratase
VIGRGDEEAQRAQGENEREGGRWRRNDFKLNNFNTGILLYAILQREAHCIQHKPEMIKGTRLKNVFHICSFTINNRKKKTVAVCNNLHGSLFAI